MELIYTQVMMKQAKYEERTKQKMKIIVRGPGWSREA
jgi:hypothetical protein